MCLEPQGVLWGRYQRRDGPKDKYILGVIFFSAERWLYSKAAAEVRGERAAKSSRDPSPSTAQPVILVGESVLKAKTLSNAPGLQHKPYRQYMKI